MTDLECIRPQRTSGCGAKLMLYSQCALQLLLHHTHTQLVPLAVSSCSRGRDPSMVLTSYILMRKSVKYCWMKMPCRQPIFSSLPFLLTYRSSQKVMSRQTPYDGPQYILLSVRKTAALWRRWIVYTQGSDRECKHGKTLGRSSSLIK